MAFTGRDVAKFVSQATGEDYLKLYDEAEEQDGMMKNETTQRFKNLLERMEKIDKNNQKNIID
jgi:hypothetical protein